MLICAVNTGMNHLPGGLREKPNFILCLREQHEPVPDSAALPRSNTSRSRYPAELPVAERLYADIDFQEGSEVHGVLYLITEQHLRSLDAREGYPKVYRRIWIPVEFKGESYLALTYEMIITTKAARSGQMYHEEYRKICSEGARYYHVKNGFTTRRKKA